MNFTSNVFNGTFVKEAFDINQSHVSVEVCRVACSEAFYGAYHNWVVYVFVANIVVSTVLMIVWDRVPDKVKEWLIVLILTINAGSFLYVRFG